MAVLDGIKAYINRLISAKDGSSKSRSLLLYLFFVIISAILWCFLTFNNTITLEMQVPVIVKAKPDNVRFLSNFADTVTVTVSDKGTSFIKYIFKSTPKLELRFSDYATGEGVFKVDATRLKKLIARKLSRGANIVSVLPDNINVKFTDAPGKLVPVVVDIDIKPQLLYMQNGPVTKSQDSVMVFSDPTTLANISEVYTYHINAIDLTDTLRRKVSIAPLRGAVVEPRSLEVVVPIEKMVSKRQKVQVSVRNQPEGVKVIVFPSSVEISYRAPMSAQKKHADVTAVVDYNSIDTKSNKVAVKVGEAPAIYQDFRISVDSVEYIVEKQKLQ